MELTLDNKKLELNFGLRFIRELDKAMPFSPEKNGPKINFGMGLVQVLTGIQTNNAGMLSVVIYAAAWNNTPRPSQAEIDKALEGLTLTKLTKVFDSVTAEMGKSTQVQLTAKNMKA